MCRQAGDGSECRVLTVCVDRLVMVVRVGYFVCRWAGDGSECRVLTVCVDGLVMVVSVGYLLCVSTGW